MSDRQVQVIPGDKVTLTVTGKVAEPNPNGTAAKGMSVRIYRPAKYSGLLAAQLSPDSGAVNVNVILDADAEIDYEVTSAFKNGVHIDGNGRYWMRRPGGWHEMTVKDDAVRPILGGVFVPPNVQRLKEDKDQ